MASELPASVKAIAYHEPKGAGQLTTYTPKPLGEHDADIVVTYNGVCASDLHHIDGNWGQETYPLVPGHEIVGHVLNVGAKVTEFKKGDVVGLGPLCSACFTCESCKADRDNMCKKRVLTYGKELTDETGTHRTYGGFGSFVRTDSRLMVHIPKGVEERHAGPLLCGGLTVASPLFEWAKGHDCRGKRIGILGIGGLGHLAIQFAAKAGAETIAISRSSDKKEFCEELGATGYIDLSNPADVADAQDSFDWLLICNSGGRFDIPAYANFVKPYGAIHYVGVPLEPITFNAFVLLLKNITLSASLVGSRAQMQDMLHFAAKHDVKPIIEEFPHSRADDAVQKVRDGSIRFRAVLKNDLI